jgi:surface antigen
MRNTFGLGAALVAGMLCAVPAAAQDGTDVSSYPVGTCRQVLGQADIDGTTQPVSGLACLQPDGTWQFVQNLDGSWVIPESDYAYYYGSWYWGPPILFGASFVLVDRFHHFHHFDHFHDHVHVVFHGSVMHVRGGWGGPHAWGSPHGWAGMGAGSGGFHRH